MGFCALSGVPKKIPPEAAAVGSSSLIVPKFLLYGKIIPGEGFKNETYCPGKIKSSHDKWLNHFGSGVPFP